jgi:hypothetical protein
MKNSRIPEILAELSTLLRRADQADWAKACERLASEYGHDPNETRRTILAMYGGMGSFNDVVLYQGGAVLVAENDALDRLRSLLHRECRSEL